MQSHLQTSSFAPPIHSSDHALHLENRVQCGNIVFRQQTVAHNPLLVLSNLTGTGKVDRNQLYRLIQFSFVRTGCFIVLQSLVG